MYVNDFNYNDILSQIKNNKNILIFTFPGSLLNRLSQSIPIFFLASFNPLILGYFSFSSQLLNYPLKLFNGLGNMFKKEFNDEIRSSNTFKKTFFKYLKIFSIISFLLLLGVFVFSDLLVPLFFGKKWIDSMPIMKILVIMVSVRYVVAGLSSVLLIGKFPKYDIIFQASYFIITLVSVYLSKQIFNSYNSVINSYVISSIFAYMLYLLLIKHLSNQKINF